MAKNKKIPPVRKKTAAILTLTFLVAEFIFIVTMLGSMPMLQDTIHIKNLDEISTFFNRYIFYFDVIATFIVVIDLVMVLRIFPVHGFPSFVAYFAMVGNFVTCAIASIFLYFVDLRGIDANLQIFLILPLVFIFLSSVFLIDDTFDLFRGKYTPYIPKKMRAQYTTRKIAEDDSAHKGAEKDIESADNTSAEEKINEYLKNQRDRIANAALKTIPKLDEDKII